VKQFIEIARILADGKPITILLGPYADDTDCPSRIRAALSQLIDDKALRLSLHGFGRARTLICHLCFGRII
jgi:hypothetical protein